MRQVCNLSRLPHWRIKRNTEGVPKYSSSSSLNLYSISRIWVSLVKRCHQSLKSSAMPRSRRAAQKNSQRKSTESRTRATSASRSREWQPLSLTPLSCPVGILLMLSRLMRARFLITGMPKSWTPLSETLTLTKTKIAPSTINSLSITAPLYPLSHKSVRSSSIRVVQSISQSCWVL